MKLFYMFLVLFCLNTFAANVIQRQDEVSITNTSTQILDINLKRSYLLIQNKGSANVYIKFNTAHSGIEGVKIIPGGNWESEIPPTSLAFAKAESGTNLLTIIEGVK